MTDLINVRELRQNLKRYLQRDKATIIGDEYHQRGLLIPLSPNYIWNRGERRKVIARAQREANRVLKELRHHAR